MSDKQREFMIKKIRLKDVASYIGEPEEIDG
jgi:hypothetical protein